MPSRYLLWIGSLFSFFFIFLYLAVGQFLVPVWPIAFTSLAISLLITEMNDRPEPDNWKTFLGHIFSLFGAFIGVIFYITHFSETTVDMPVVSLWWFVLVISLLGAVASSWYIAPQDRVAFVDGKYVSPGSWHWFPAFRGRKAQTLSQQKTQSANIRIHTYDAESRYVRITWIEEIDRATILPNALYTNVCDVINRARVDFRERVCAKYFAQGNVDDIVRDLTRVCWSVSNSNAMKFNIRLSSVTFT